MYNNYGQKEQISHGDSLFPLNVYRLDLGCISHIMECHWHEESEIIYMKRGKAVFQIDTENVEVCEGQIIFVNSGSLHSGFALEKSYCEFYAVVFDLKMLSSSTSGYCQSMFLAPLINNQLSLPLSLVSNPDCQQSVEKQLLEIFADFEQKLPGYELSIKGALLKIFSVLIGNNLFTSSPGRENSANLYKIERIKNVLSYIENNYRNRISIASAAEELNMSSYYFCRFFKYMTGRTLTEYINYYRVNKASQLLLEGDRKITDIAFDTGFENVSYFIKVFKNLKGFTPAEFRKLSQYKSKKPEKYL